ncbi:hypothetical protein RRF57_008678 [Xylaria bambusicola]|uniref:Uncharacterized protein n=1 Tax=Xylaria bambusicola TaxID=326684 RepID=A0AAN7USI2_9PEZI
MLDTHSISKLHEIGVLLIGMRISVLVKEVLPLSDHTLLLVIENNDLDTNIELYSGGKFSKGHIERGVTVNVNDQGIRPCNLGTNSSRQSVSHSA